MKNNTEIIQLIDEYSHLFWYTPENEKENISMDLLVETILNYGDLDAFKKLINTMGIKTVANIFYNHKERKKLNYYPEIYNFFTLYFNKYA